MCQLSDYKRHFEKKHNMVYKTLKNVFNVAHLLNKYSPPIPLWFLNISLALLLTLRQRYCFLHPYWSSASIKTIYYLPRRKSLFINTHSSNVINKLLKKYKSNDRYYFLNILYSFNLITFNVYKSNYSKYVVF